MENVSVNNNLQKLLFVIFFLFIFFQLKDCYAFHIIAIDPGHGGYETGLRTPSGKEKDQVLLLAKQMESVLTGIGKQVYLTRSIDQFLSINERSSRANKERPDLFISIHMSDSSNFALYITTYEGKIVELSLDQYYSIPSRQRKFLYECSILATFIEESIKNVFGKKVFHREMPLPLLNSLGAPAMLVEIPDEGINFEEERLRLASSIVLGILNYEER